jgi:putative sigma-54 modulation protein
MDLVTRTVATDKVEFRCNAPLSEADRSTAMEKIARFARSHPEIVRMSVDVECDAESDQPSSFVAKGQVEIGGPGLLASVADHSALKCVEYLVENFDRQLRRRKPARVRSFLPPPRAPQPVLR